MTKALAFITLIFSLFTALNSFSIVFADQTIVNIATSSSSTSDPDLSNNTVQVRDIIKESNITGHIFYDINGNGIQDVNEPDLANVEITAKYSDGTEVKVTTDLSGNYTIPLKGSNITISVNKNNQNIPEGSIVSTISSGGSDVQNIGNGQFQAKPVGFFKPFSDLSLQKTVDTPIAKKSDNLTYRILYRNKGVSDAVNVEVTDTMPPGFEYVSANINPQSVEKNGNQVILKFIIASLPAGAEGSLLVIANVQSETGTKVNEARIISAIGDPEISNNLSTASVEIYDPTNVGSLVRTGGIIIKQDSFRIYALILILSIAFIGFIYRSSSKSIQWSKPKV